MNKKQLKIAENSLKQLETTKNEKKYREADGKNQKKGIKNAWAHLRPFCGRLHKIENFTTLNTGE